MRSIVVGALAALLITAPAAAQDTALDSLRQEAVRSRAFIRGAETQLTKVLAMIDAILAADTVAPPPDTTTPPPPPDTTTPPPPPPGASGRIYFASDWSSATGNSVGAILDGGRWGGGAGNWRNSFSVVPAPAGFPTDFVLEQRGLAESGSWGQIELYCGDSYGAPCDAALGLVPELQVGDSLGMRVYWQSPNPYGSVDNLLHGFEVLDPGNTPYGINSRYGSGGWQIEIDVDPGGEVYGPRGSSGFGAYDIAPDQVVMLEVLAVRTGANQIHVEARLTDVTTGTVMRDVDEWTAYYNPNAQPMHVGTPFQTSSAAWRNLREWRMGINGIGNVDGRVVHRWGAFALCSGWCPAYAAGEGR